jgi:mRNA interferase MazF
MNYEEWEIVLLPFPFTDLTTTKKGPALIILPDEYNKRLDVVTAFITSKLDLEYLVGNYKIEE